MARLALDDAAWSSAWRHRSTAEKALLSLGLLLIAVTSPGPVISLLVFGVVLFIAIGFARVSPRGYFLALIGPASFVLLGALVIAVHIGSAVPQAWWSWGPFSMSSASLATATAVLTRSIAAFSALLLFASTTPMSDVLVGLRRLRVPEVLIDIAGLIYRMLFSLLGSAAAIMEAQRARLGYSSGPAARRSVGVLGGAILLQAWNRARRLEAGLAGRGYTGSLRTLTTTQPVSVPFVALSTGLLVVLGTASVLWAVSR